MLARHLNKTSTIHKFYYYYSYYYSFYHQFLLWTACSPSLSSCSESHESDLTQHSQGLLG